MMLISKLSFSFFVFLTSLLISSSHGHEIEIKIPVWNVGNIFSKFIRSTTTTTRRPTRTPRPTTEPTPPTKPTEPQNPEEPNICEIYPQLPLCQETTPPTEPEVPEEPKICDIYPELPLCQETSPPTDPTEPQVPEEPSLCDIYPALPICQEMLRNNDYRGYHYDLDFCFYYPNLCTSSKNPQRFVPLTDYRR